MRDIEYVEFNGNVWRKLSGEEKVWIGRWCDEEIRKYYGELR